MTDQNLTCLRSRPIGISQKRWFVVAALLLPWMAGSVARADSFTLQHNNRNYVCTSTDDNGVGGGSPPATVVYCGCTWAGTSYGQVVGSNASAQCKAITPNHAGLIKGCANLSGVQSDTVGCDCTWAGTSYGQVTAAMGEAASLVRSCMDITPNQAGVISGCSILH